LIGERLAGIELAKPAAGFTASFFYLVFFVDSGFDLRFQPADCTIAERNGRRKLAFCDAEVN
jgi:hypothetical protein